MKDFELQKTDKKKLLKKIYYKHVSLETKKIFCLKTLQSFILSQNFKSEHVALKFK